MKRLAALFVFAGLVSNGVFAVTVPVSEARNVAIQFYFSRLYQFQELSPAEISITQEFVIEESGQPLFYVFNFSPEGFVMVSADDVAWPVPCYSFESSYSGNNPPPFTAWISQYKKQVAHAITYKATQPEATKLEWEKWRSANYLLPGKDERAVAPMLHTTWNQDIYYNDLCPADPLGPGGHCYAGCVATAMGQLMMYHRWPATGTGSYTYSHPQYGTISADFSTTTYNWNEMLRILSGPNNAVALMLHHLGVSVDMDYGPNGSGMWNHKAAYSLRTYFKYCPETQYVFRDSTTLAWDSILIANIDARKPLYYAGWEDTTFTMGHAFVCDGYQTTDYFHFNWGWGGLVDGYFYLDNLVPGGNNFNMCQELIKDMYPDTVNYTCPEYCASTGQLSAVAGTFSDGSGILAYKPNSDCNWMLNPVCGMNTRLSFLEFDLAFDDTLYIHNGPDEMAPVMQAYYGGHEPVLVSQTSPTTLESGEDGFYLRFRSGSTNEDGGFLAEYKTVFCGNDTMTDMSGSISDGSGPCNYVKTSNCRWVIKPAGAQSVTLNFTEFDLANNNTGDYVAVYKNSVSGSNLIATYNHTNVPTSLGVNSGIVIVRFVSNSSVEAGGWALDYVASMTGISESTLPDKGISVMPNPFSENSMIRFLNEKSGMVSCLISDSEGRTIAYSENHQQAGTCEFLIRELVPDIKAGVYFVKIVTPNCVYLQKVICNGLYKASE